jgi:hypothetical protein
MAVGQLLTRLESDGNSLAEVDRAQVVCDVECQLSVDGSGAAAEQAYHVAAIVTQGSPAAQQAAVGCGLLHRVIAHLQQAPLDSIAEAHASLLNFVIGATRGPKSSTALALGAVPAALRLLSHKKLPSVHAAVATILNLLTLTMGPSNSTKGHPYSDVFLAAETGPQLSLAFHRPDADALLQMATAVGILRLYKGTVLPSEHIEICEHSVTLLRHGNEWGKAQTLDALLGIVSLQGLPAAPFFVCFSSRSHSVYVGMPFHLCIREPSAVSH